MAPKGEDNSVFVLCDREILYHGMLCVSAIGVIITQATILNFYIIAFFRGYRHHVATYFWFLGDLFIVCLFAISFTTAYRYIHMRRKFSGNRTLSEKNIQQKIRRSIYKHVLWLSPVYCGTLPFAFLSWLAYSVYLVGKVGVIFNSEIPAFMTNFTAIELSFTNDPANNLGSNLLKVTIGLSALVFIIMLQAHHNHDPDSPHSGYISGICHNTAVEVFDSVTLLSLIIVQDKDSHFSKIWNFDGVIIVLSSLNLILPTLALTVFNYELSLFVVKNLCYIFMLSHSLYPGMVKVTKRFILQPASKLPALAITTTEQLSQMELTTIRSSSGKGSKRSSRYSEDFNDMSSPGPT
ncbi:hypothetical protein TCAL_07791 [Tigriopus californicus]|uniref:Uncharacterized protein n=1 Tax=Tigriopus californicus TaxID=6832 RepID=A0A553PTU2_TIGCA|nr:hypothetical protein TCAL_07791 [Tigriopus californicus]|eukprot:TCALIF_07791-PA protein Name:"Protein of unknown function" AED:0.04 eAED:0.04 QI:279/0.85/0.87/1/0.42/0.5/8/207/350